MTDAVVSTTADKVALLLAEGVDSRPVATAKNNVPEAG
jgi:hypothetical protein